MRARDEDRGLKNVCSRPQEERQPASAVLHPRDGRLSPTSADAIVLVRLDGDESRFRQ